MVPLSAPISISPRSRSIAVKIMDHARSDGTIHHYNNATAHPMHNTARCHRPFTENISCHTLTVTLHVLINSCKRPFTVYGPDYSTNLRQEGSSHIISLSLYTFLDISILPMSSSMSLNISCIPLPPAPLSPHACPPYIGSITPRYIESIAPRYIESIALGTSNPSCIEPIAPRYIESIVHCYKHI